MFKHVIQMDQNLITFDKIILMENNNQDNQSSTINQSTAGGLSSLMAPPQRGIRPGGQRGPGPVRGVGGINPMQMAPSQASVIKSVQQILPKMQNDADRQNVREQIVDALIRDPGPQNPQRLQELNKMIQDHLNEQQQQSKQSQSNDECSSGGTTPTLNRQNTEHSENSITQILKLAMWLEEAIFEKFNDTKAANYRTLVRRLTQALRSRDGGPQKQALMACSDAEQVNLFLQDVLNQRGAGSSGGVPHMRQGENFGPGSTSTQEASPSQFGNAGNAAGNSGNVNQQNNQEQSAQSVPNPTPAHATNPFAAGRGMGAPRGPPRGGAPRGRGMPRFAPPRAAHFPPPMAGGPQAFAQPPLPQQPQAPQSTNLQNLEAANEEQKQSSSTTSALAPPPQNNQALSTLRPPSMTAPPLETTSWTPQKQMIESGSADDSSVLLTPNSPKNKNTIGAVSGYQQDKNANHQIQPNNASLQQEQQEKDAGSGQIGLDFFDQLGNGSGSVGQGASQIITQGPVSSPDLDFLQEYLNVPLNTDGTKKEEPTNIPSFQVEQQEQSSNLQNQIINQNSQGNQYIGKIPLDDNQHQDGGHIATQEEVHGLTSQEERAVQVGANGEDQEGEQRPDIDRAPSNQNQEESNNQQTHPANPNLNTRMQQLQKNNAFMPDNSELQSQSLQMQPQSNHQISNIAENQQEQRSGQSQNGAPAVQEHNLTDRHQDNNSRGDGLVAGGINEYAIPERQGAWSAMNMSSTQLADSATLRSGTTNEIRDVTNLKVEGSSLNVAMCATQPNINDLAGETGSHATKQNYTYTQPCDQDEIEYSKQGPGYPSVNEGEYGNRKISSGKNSSKPHSARMTPPSGRSGGKSIRAVATPANPNGEQFDFAAGRASTSQSNHEETGSVPNDQNPNDKFMPFQGHKDLNMKNGGGVKPAETRHEDLMSMDNRAASGTYVYRQSEVWESVANPKEFQSDFKTKPEKNRQVEGFMQSHQIIRPPESVAPSMGSVPVTSFDDTQQMLRAYKKKKRELAKMKETFFKMETEFVTTSNRKGVLEEELAQVQKRLSKAEKQLKQSQKREQQKDNSLTEKQLMLKTKETEVFQRELANQKQENQKLREKVRDLLKKSSNTASSQGGGITDERGNKAAEIQMIQQQHQLDLQRERESFEQKNKSLEDEMNYYKSKCSRIEQEMSGNQSATEEQREQARQVRQRYEEEIEQLKINSKNELEQVREATRKSIHENLTNNANAKEQKLNFKIQELSSENEAFQRKLNDAFKVQENLQNELNQSKLWIDQLNQDNIHLRDSTDKIEFENQELKQTVSNYEAQSQEQTYVQQPVVQELSSQHQMSSSKDFSIQPEGKDSKQSSSLAQSQQITDNKVSSQSAQDNLNEGQKLFEQDASTNSWQVLGESSDQHSNAHYGTQNASHQSSKLQSGYNDQQHQPSDQQINASPAVHQSNQSAQQISQISKDLPQPDYYQEGLQQPLYPQSNQGDSNLMIQSQYFPNYQQPATEAPNPISEQNQPLENRLQPRQNQVYDFTLEEIGDNQQTEDRSRYRQLGGDIPDLVERSYQKNVTPNQNSEKPMFQESSLNNDSHPPASGIFQDDQTDVVNVMQVSQQTEASNFFTNQIQNEEYRQQPVQASGFEAKTDLNTGQSNTQVMTQNVQNQQQPTIYNNDPYNFFDDDNDNQEGFTNNSGNNVIPNSMFD